MPSIGSYFSILGPTAAAKRKSQGAAAFRADAAPAPWAGGLFSRIVRRFIGVPRQVPSPGKYGQGRPAGSDVATAHLPGSKSPIISAGPVVGVVSTSKSEITYPKNLHFPSDIRAEHPETFRALTEERRKALSDNCKTIGTMCYDSVGFMVRCDDFYRATSDEDAEKIFREIHRNYVSLDGDFTVNLHGSRKGALDEAFKAEKFSRQDAAKVLQAAEVEVWKMVEADVMKRLPPPPTDKPSA